MIKDILQGIRETLSSLMRYPYPLVESRVLQGTDMFHVLFAELWNRFWRRFSQNGISEETEMQNF